MLYAIIYTTLTDVKVTAATYTDGGDLSMYEGTNQIAIQSVRWFTEALTELMADTEYNRINVMQICKKADLSRQTFYNYFDTKEDILHCRLKQVYMERFAQFSECGEITLQSAVEAFETILKSERVLLERMVANHLEGIITEEICACVTLFSSRFTITPQKETLKYGIAFLSGALSQTIVCWFKDENPVSASELADMLTQILTGVYFDVST